MKEPMDNEKLATAARELLYLYDWRPELAKLEESAKDENGGNADDRKKVAKLLREYGNRKKTGWITLRAALVPSKGTESAD